MIDKLEEHNQEAEQGEQVLIPVEVDDHLGGRSEILQTTKALYDVIEMDDDNDPALENIPLDNENTTTVFDTEEWRELGVWQGYQWL